MLTARKPRMKREFTVVLSAAVPYPAAIKLDRLATASDMSRSEYIRTLIEKHVSDETDPDEDPFDNPE